MKLIKTHAIRKTNTHKTCTLLHLNFFFTEVCNFVRMLPRALDEFLLERLIFYTVSNAISQQITVYLRGRGPIEFQDIGASAEDSVKKKKKIIRKTRNICELSATIRSRDFFFISDDSYFTLTCGLFGTPPGVLT